MRTTRHSRIHSRHLKRGIALILLALSTLAGYRFIGCGGHALEGSSATPLPPAPPQKVTAKREPLWEEVAPAQADRKRRWRTQVRNAMRGGRYAAMERLITEIEAAPTIEQGTLAEQTRLVLIRAYLSAGRLDDARRHAAVLGDPGPMLHDHRLGVLVELAVCSEEWDEVLRLLTGAAPQSADSIYAPRFVAWAAQANLQLGNASSARVLLAEWQSLAEDDPFGTAVGWRRSLVESELRTAAQLGLEDEGQTILRHWLREDPDAAFNDRLLEIWAEHTGEDTQSLDWQLDLLGFEGAIQRGETLRWRSRFEQLERETIRLIQKHARNGQERDEARLLRGRGLFSARKYIEAGKAFRLMERWASSEESRSEAIFWQGRSQARRGRYGAAEKLYRRVISRGGARVGDAWYRIALGDLETDKPEEAARSLRQLLKTDAVQWLHREARWRLGWKAWQEGGFAAAESQWRRLIPLSDRYFDRLRALYWHARSLEALGRHSEAIECARNLVEGYPPNWYSWWAARRWLKEDQPAAWRFSQNGSWRDIEFEALLEDAPETARKHLKRGEILGGLGDYEIAAVELQAADRLLKNQREWDIPLAQLRRLIEDYHASQQAIRIRHANHLLQPFKEGDQRLWQLAYTRGYSWLVEYYTGHYGLPSDLVYALIQEESRYEADAVSWADAHGLMQIIPPTAQNIARRLRYPRPVTRESLARPRINIAFGIFYINDLVNRADGNAVFALAGYNGGPNNVKKWRERYQPDIRGLDDFVEQIPYRETRRYVKKVISSYLIYRTVYSEAGGRPLAGDPILEIIAGDLPLNNDSAGIP